MSHWIKVAKTEDVPTNTGLSVEAEGHSIALYKVDGKVYAIDGVCPHAGGALAEGSLNGCLAMCPWHGWEFDVRTGKCDFNSEIAVKTYPTKEEKGEVFVQI